MLLQHGLDMSCLTLLLESHSLHIPLQLWAFSRDNLVPGSKYMGFCSTGSLNTNNRTHSLFSWVGCTCNDVSIQVTACRHKLCCLLEGAGHNFADVCWARARHSRYCAHCLQYPVSHVAAPAMFCLTDGGPKGVHARPAIPATT